MNPAKFSCLIWIVLGIATVVWAVLTPGTLSSVVLAAAGGACLGTHAILLIDECGK